MTTAEAKTAETSCRIDGELTLKQLEELRAKYGVVHMKLDFEQFRHPMSVSALIVTTTHTVIGRGSKIAQALDDGFSRLIHRIGSDLLLIHKERP